MKTQIVDETPPKSKRKKGDPPDEPHYRTVKGYYLVKEHLEWWGLFWKVWGSYGGKSEAAESFRRHCKKKVINKKNIQLVCDAAEHEKAGRDHLIALGSRPIYPQGWLTAARWETYEEQLKSGRIKPTHKNIEKQFPKDWKLRLSRLIWEKYPDLIKKLESGYYKTPADMPPELQDQIR